MGVFEVFNILSLSLTHQHVFCFKLNFYNSIEACCDKFCSKTSKELSYFLLGLRKKSLNITQKHKVDVSQIFIGRYSVFQEKHLPQKCSLQNYEFLEWNITASIPNNSVLLCEHVRLTQYKVNIGAMWMVYHLIDVLTLKTIVLLCH